MTGEEETARSYLIRKSVIPLLHKETAITASLDPVL